MDLTHFEKFFTFPEYLAKQYLDLFAIRVDDFTFINRKRG